jgi:hypothetical protein
MVLGKVRALLHNSSSNNMMHDGMQDGKNAYRWKVVRYIP